MRTALCHSRTAEAGCHIRRCLCRGQSRGHVHHTGPPTRLAGGAHTAGQRRGLHPLRVRDAGVASGTYPFAIYHWQKHGIRPEVTFQVVCTAPALTEPPMRNQPQPLHPALSKLLKSSSLLLTRCLACS
jgi:hypothetical protein